MRAAGGTYVTNHSRVHVPFDVHRARRLLETREKQKQKAYLRPIKRLSLIYRAIKNNEVWGVLKALLESTPVAAASTAFEELN